MPSAYTALFYHIVYSTKNREPMIPLDLRPRLFAYTGGICRKIDGSLLAAGGVQDHVHLLAKLPATLALADAVRTLKSNTSRWMHEQGPAHASFEWQESYSGFTIGRSGIEDLTGYLARQEEHHRKTSFDEELDKFYEKYGIEPTWRRD